MIATNWRGWMARFLPAEVLGLVGSYAGYLVCSRAGFPPAVAAYGAAMGENCVYYAVIFLRDLAAQPPGQRRAGTILRAMIHDFGLAEALDTLVMRPGATLLAVTVLGEAIGIAVGKVAADAVFYGLAITFWERRRAREGAR